VAGDPGDKLRTTGKLAEALSVSATAVLNVENQLRAARKRDE
jgi:hypothetical protein